MNQQQRGDSVSRWFLRGVAASVVFMAAVNAASYFFRSTKWHSLQGQRSDQDESIGFPWKMWEGGNDYGGLYVDYVSLALNVVVALAIGTVVGVVIASQTRKLNKLFSFTEFESCENQPHRIQFSLIGLMVATGIVAVVAMLATQFAARRETLLAIYLFGPLVLVALAMLPRKLTWQTRVWLIIPTTLSLIAAAIGVGMNLRIEFDRVLLAIFLCWTPQSALAALLLTAWLTWSISSKQTEELVPSNESVK
ncbi:MAG: hypothetical protein WBD20_16480 [Pirellulaceae bacterium]